MKNIIIIVIFVCSLLILHLIFRLTGREEKDNYSIPYFPPYQDNDVSTLLHPTKPVYHYQTPSQFNWMEKSFITRPVNQEKCGICWAVSIATVCSDRYAIALQKQGKDPENPNFSYTALATCATYENVCRSSVGQGGGWEWVLNNGLIKTSCNKSAKYDWCLQKKECQGNWGVDDMKSVDLLTPPLCKEFASCEHYMFRDLVTFYGTNQINEIKQEIMSNGPLVSYFNVTTEFLDVKNWTPTGIYVHNYKNRTWSDKDQDDCCDYSCNEGDPESASCSGPKGSDVGGHAISIVGWGEEESIPYWIVRNSFGNDWNRDGTFKSAMSNASSYVGLGKEMLGATPITEPQRPDRQSCQGGSCTADVSGAFSSLYDCQRKCGFVHMCDKLDDCIPYTADKAVKNGMLWESKEKCIKQKNEYNCLHLKRDY